MKSWMNSERKNQIARFVASAIKPMANMFQRKSVMNKPYRNRNHQSNAMALDFRAFCSENTPVVMGGISLLMVSVLGVYCFINIDLAMLGFEIPEKVVIEEQEPVTSIEVLTEEPADFVEPAVQASAVVAEVKEPVQKPALLPTEKLPFSMESVKNIKYDQRFAIDCYGILVDGKEIAYVETFTDGEAILDIIEANYLDEENVIEESFFGENVELIEIRKDAGAFEPYLEAEEIASYILRGTDEEKIHEVEKGENYWLIADNYNISVDNLIQANPKVNPERLQIGQEISLIVPKPLISVVTKEIAEYSEFINFEVTYEESSSYYKGEFSVKKSGKKGERVVVAEIYKENGVEKERVILEENILSDPVTKVVYKGTKNPPPRIGTGTFSKPTSRGTISSGYGMRWGRRHNGIDIAIPIGTPVKAADGGVVIFSGDKGGYGRCVIIDHGANMSTLYGHNSTLLVKKGDKVFKGQTIAKSGNTGRSTGPHLHFEVRKNNVPTNPSSYVKY